jgi:hypothetical protein
MDPASGGADAAEWRTRAPGGTEYSWCRAVPGGTGTTLLALRLAPGGAAAVTAVQGALRSLQSAHPALRARLRPSPSGPTLAFPTPAPPPPPLLPLAPLPAPVSAPDFDALLEHELNRNPWAESESSPSDSDAPVLFATLYELPPPGGAALFVRIHTVACDRSATAALARELVALLSGAEEDGEREPEAAAAEAGLEERIPQQDTWKPFWARGMDMVGYSINGLRTSTLPFVETGTERSTQMLRLGLGRGETARLLDVSSNCLFVQSSDRSSSNPVVLHWHMACTSDQ